MTTERIRCAVIGAGTIAKQHMEQWGQLPELQVIACCDVAEDRAVAAAQRFGARAFTDVARMLDDTEPQAAFVFLPPFAHGETERALIQRRVPFLIEKPVGLDLGLCRELAAAIHEADLLTSVGYMNRYRPSVQRARQVFQDDPPCLAHGGWVGGTPRVPWWVQKRLGGGQLTEQTTHTVDLVRYLLGEAVEVFTHAVPSRTFNRDGVPPEYDVEDASVVTIRCASGAVATIWSTCTARAGGGVTLTIYGNRHSAFFTGWEHALRLISLDDRGERSEEAVSAGTEHPFLVEDRAWLHAVRTGDRGGIRTDYADGIKTLAVTLAADESFTTGKPIALDG